MFVSGPILTRKYWTGLERLARDKHSTLLRKSVNNGRNKFIAQATGCKGLEGTNTLAYWAYLGVTKKIKYFEKRRFLNAKISTTTLIRDRIVGPMQLATKIGRLPEPL